jgi:peptide/nickel transport system permease protein
VLRFLVKRLAGLVITLLIASFLIFSSLYAAPGSPLATLAGGRTLPPEAVISLNARYHLDDPFLARYGLWLGDAVTGDLGESFVFKSDVSDLVTARVRTSLTLVGMASILILLFGITLGVTAAIKGGWFDNVVLIGTVVAQAVPSFVAAIFLIWIFAVELSWFPAIGAGEGFTDQLYHLTLPAIALALAYSAYVTRISRAATRDEMGREHVETARARGFTPRQIVTRHVVRNAMIPISTVACLSVAGLLATTVVVERAFNLDGLGSLLVEAVVRKDFAVVQAVSLVIVTAFVVINSAVDVLYALLDPRIELGRRR